MTYFHCPKTFRSKDYGCGFGPVNATIAFLDMSGKCSCGKELKTVRKTSTRQQARQADIQRGIDNVRALFGDAAAERYAKEKGA